MSKVANENILSSTARGKYIGRTNELDQLLRHAKGHGRQPGLTVLAAPGVGLSELLTQIYDQLFYEQGEIIPFYFRVKKSDRTVRQLSIRFLQEFIQQIVAFRRADSSFLGSHPDLCEIAEVALPSDGPWIDRLVEACELRSPLNEENAMIRNALSAPLRAGAHGANSYVLIDDIEVAGTLEGDFDLFEELKEIFSRSENPYVFAGKRRFLFEASQKGQSPLDAADILELKHLDFADGGLFVESLASAKHIAITDQTRDLIVKQFLANPALIVSVLKTAHEKGLDLDTFRRVEEVYATSLFGGKIKGLFDTAFDNVTPSIEAQSDLIELLFETSGSENVPSESWMKRLKLERGEFYSVMKKLNTYEFTRQSSNMVEVARDNSVLSDYINMRFRLERKADARSLVVAESLSAFLKRAPDQMANFYRRSSALGVRELMSTFDCQDIPSSLCDYEEYKSSHKGKNSEDAFADISSEEKSFTLPQIIYTAHTVSLYSPINKLTESERSAVALGFEAADYKDESEIVWIAAEIDSKLEADKELTSFWCDRLEMVALMCDFPRYRLWLIAPEGFAPEAIEVIKDRNAIGSSRSQFELMARYLGAETNKNAANTNEYEMVLPMGDDTELIAAYAVEEIARRNSFGTKAINQIKTALVEACINATEHSQSPDRKIYQKFVVEEDKLIITVSNRGLRFKGNDLKEIQPDQGRRGWGLKLMKSLMDDVSFEQVDDGTRISMTKSLSTVN